MASSYSASLSSLGTISRSPYQEKKAPPDHRFLGDCPIVPPPATLCRYCQNRLNIVRNRLLLFWTICVYQVCYAPVMRIYLRLSTRESYVNPPSSSKQHHHKRVTAYTRAL